MSTWSTDGTIWRSEGDRYSYVVTPSNIAEFAGFIYRKPEGGMVFSLSYPSLAAARADLVRRGQAEYFVRPDDPTYQPPTFDVAPQEETPMTDPLPEGYPPYEPPDEEPAAVEPEPDEADEVDDRTTTPVRPIPPVFAPAPEEEEPIEEPMGDTSTSEPDDLIPTGEQFPNHIVTVYLDAKNEYRWNRRAANGKVISHSAESYPERRRCLRGLALANQDTNYRIRDRAKTVGK